MLADYHVHTEFSDDSLYPLKSVIHDAWKMGLDEIAITDHVDYGVKNDIDGPIVRYESEYPVTNVPYEAFFASLNANIPLWTDRIQVARGLELGVQMRTLDEFNALLDQYEKQMDFAILSIHQVDNLEFWDGGYQKGRNQEEIHGAYWDEMLNVVNSFDRYCVMGHLDLIRRYDPFGAYDFENYRDACAEVLKVVIANGHGIEVNTSGIRYGLGEFQPSDKILKLYRDLGGTIVTVGSDSHKPDHLGKYIQDAYDLLASLGFENVYTYRNWEPIPNKLG